jgi:hypothetical protein
MPSGTEGLTDTAHRWQKEECKVRATQCNRMLQFNIISSFIYIYTNLLSYRKYMVTDK